jgi:hypothetical protein
MNMALARWSGRALIAAGLVGLAMATSLARGEALRRRDQWPAEADNLYLPSSSTMARTSLGHRELAADLVAAKANVYFGTQILSKAPQRWLERYITTAVDLDPHFHRMYLAGAAMLVYNGQRISVDAVEAANRLLARGIEVFPFDWELRFQRGFNLLFELPNLTGEDDPRVPHWRQEGVEELRQATLFEGVPYWLPSLVARMLTKQGSNALAIKHLEQAYAIATTEEARRQILLKLRHLQASQLSSRLEEDRQAFEELLKNGYPYAPEAFTVIAGPKRPRAVEIPYRTPAR